MPFIDGRRGMYRPIRVFDTSIYKLSLQICWHIESYKTKIALGIHFRWCQASSPASDEPGSGVGKASYRAVQSASSSKQVDPRHVVVQVVPEVLQGF
ncbi:hypothetical protein KUCAC02_011221 [Chaenocephalus aceratus]|uniref:Uncharacterized protein n=1 Tax=Chaenocephalus aceratus TaxID=36190 RepID=A0ACB9WV23_CHAAC|nr:hypothetical protein KUCAC02_011221 [Chaenocephalus aceratus]